MKFRKKPVVVEAEQYKGFYYSPWPPGVRIEEGTTPFVVTAHGQRVFIEPGDWIIAEPEGRGFYPCKADIFEANYEPVEGE